MAPHAVRYCMTLMACALVALNGFRHSELVGNAVLAREETASHSHLRRRALTSSPSEFGEQVPVKTELMDHRLAILLPYLSLDIPPYVSSSAHPRHRTPQRLPHLLHPFPNLLRSSHSSAWEPAQLHQLLTL